MNIAPVETAFNAVILLLVEVHDVTECCVQISTWYVVKDVNLFVAGRQQVLAGQVKFQSRYNVCNLKQD